jgi:hypothetical protein
MSRPDDFEKLRSKYPWPVQRPDVNPTEWSLDGGGRELVSNRIPQQENFLIIEVGVFLGSSVKKWLAVSPKAHVIAIDPWEGMWWADYAAKNGRQELVEQFKKEDGPYLTFLSSLWEHKERVFPVRGVSPNKLYEIAELGVQPDLIYFDSDKSGDDIEAAHQLFPSAILTGDDWTWPGPDMEFPIRKAVRKFAKKHGYFVRSHNATWIVDQHPYTPADYMKKGIEGIKDLNIYIQSMMKRS